jgi:hypothetical protein
MLWMRDGCARWVDGESVKASKAAHGALHFALLHNIIRAAVIPPLSPL